MELCTARATSNRLLLHSKPFAPKGVQSQSVLRGNAHFPLLHKQSRFGFGLRYRSNSSLRSTTSEGTSTETTDTASFVKDDPKYDGGIAVDTQPVEKTEEKDSQVNEAPEEGSQYLSNSSLQPTSSEETTTYTSDTVTVVKDEPTYDGGATVVDTQPVAKSEYSDSQIIEAPKESSSVEDLPQLSKFLEDLDIKFDSEDTYSILVFGGGAAVAVWLLAAIFRAIDSIPVFPKVLELIGLGYSLWFSYRFLIFKQNRDDLFARVEQIKQEVLGSKDD